MASRTATPARVTGGRPATMTRSAVQQARTQTRPTTPTADSAGAEPPTAADGWVNVDHNKRKHRQGPLLPTGVGAPATTAHGRATTGREMRRTQSALDATSASMAIPDKDEPPVARPNARADALSAAVTMDKKARERSYYANASAGGASSPPASLSLTTAPTWGSPPPPPGFASQRGTQHRAKSTSPDAAAAALQLERGSSLQKLMSAWQVSDDGAEPPTAPVGGVGGGGNGYGNGSNARAGGGAARTGGSGELMPGQMQSLGGMFDFGFGEYTPPPDVAGANVLRRTQSDVLPSTMSREMNRSHDEANGGHRQRSPAGRTQGEGKRSNGNLNGNGNGNANNGNGAGNANQPNGTRKCGDKRDFFFRNLDFETRSLLQIDEVASFSVTDFEMAKKISGAIVDLFPDLKAYAEQQAAADAFFYGLSGQDPALQPQRKFPLIITDATACVGGNVLSFCDYFHFVYAIENDATRVAMLENNLRVLNKTNVACRCASYLDVMYEYHQDVVFFDPPWGGPEYKDQDKVDLYLDEQPLYEICEQLQGYAKCIVLKVPTNFDDEKFAYCVSGRVTVRKDFKKMHLVVLDFR